MLKIRLQRVGRKNDPSFRVVVLESTEGPKSGNHVDEIGFYNAVTKQKNLDTEKAKIWLAKGAQPSDTVYNMLVTAGVIAGKKKNVLPQKTPIVKEAPVVEEKPAAVEEAPAEAPAEESQEVAEENAPEMPETAEENATPSAEPQTESAPEEAPAEVVTESSAEAPAEEPAA